MTRNTKSVIVTVIFGIMLIAIDLGLLRLYPVGFGIITGALAIYGFWQFERTFCGWLQELDEPYDLPEPVASDDLLSEDFAVTYEEIRREMEGDR